MTPEWADEIRRSVDEAPPLSAETRDRLWVLLAPMRAQLTKLAAERAAAAD